MQAIHEVATITAKGQITLPKSIRQALGVDYGGRSRSSCVIRKSLFRASKTNPTRTRQLPVFSR